MVACTKPGSTRCIAGKIQDYKAVKPPQVSALGIEILRGLES